MSSRSSLGRFARILRISSRNLVTVRTLVANCWRRVAMHDYSVLIWARTSPLVRAAVGWRGRPRPRGAAAITVVQGLLLRTRLSGINSTSRLARQRFGLARPRKSRSKAAGGTPAPHHQSARVGVHMRVLVSGSSGPIGAALLPFLRARGSTVTRLVRGAPTGADQITWNPAQPLSPDSVSGFDAVIHLAGETIVGRWTEAKKRRILDSRKQGTGHLAEALAKASQRP